MSERLEEQISIFVDDEMSVEECEFFVRRLERDVDARERFSRYHMIGDVLRGDHRHALPAPSDEAIALPAVAARSFSIADLPLMLGGGLAAGLVAVVLVGLQMAGAGSDIVLSQAAAAGSEETDMQYMMHHAGYVNGLSRTMTQSNLITVEDASLEPETEVVTGE